MQHPYNKLPSDPHVTGLLKFSLTNSKLKNTQTASLSLPSGFSCPGAQDCLAWFDRSKNKLKDGPDTQFRCFSATSEAAFSSLRRSVDHNYSRLKKARTLRNMVDLIDLSLPARYYENIRIHVGGDFFNQTYFRAWAAVARANPRRVFYAYTKSLPILVNNLNIMPDNFVVTASRGSKWDHLIDAHNLRSATVVFHPDEAEALGLEIDHDDSHARDPDAGDFALLIHGTQPAKSKASEALRTLREDGIAYSYPSNTKHKTTNHTV